MFRITAAATLFVGAFLCGLAHADPKCYTGPVHLTGDNNLNLWQCIDTESQNRSHFQYWSNGHWGSPADCLGGCTPCLEGAAQMGAEWAKCDQQAGSAHCAVGWSPPGKAFCSNGNQAPC